MINTLKYAKQLEEAGLTRKQAEVHMQIMADLVETNLAPRNDIRDLIARVDRLEMNLHHEIRSLRSEFRDDMKDLESHINVQLLKLEHQIQEMENRILIKVGGMLAIGLTIAVSLTKLIS
jgi:hypothetical protein